MFKTFTRFLVVSALFFWGVMFFVSVFEHLWLLTVGSAGIVVSLSVILKEVECLD